MKMKPGTPFMLVLAFAIIFTVAIADFTKLLTTETQLLLYSAICAGAFAFKYGVGV